MERLQARITELLFETVSKQEQLILKYLETNIHKLHKLTLAEVADNNYCSTTSVTRLVKKLGYSSFRELQLSLNLSRQDIGTTNLANTNETFTNALEQANCIYLYGKGASHLSTLYLFRKLIKLGYDTSIIDEQDLLYSLHHKTILCISNSGATSSVLKVMKDIKDFNNCQVLSITKANSALSNISDYAITHNKTIINDRDNQLHLLNIIDELLTFL